MNLMLSAILMSANSMRRIDPKRDINLVGALTDDELFNGATSMRARKPIIKTDEILSGHVSGDVPIDPAPADDPDFYVRRFCKRMHADTNESRIRRGMLPLPGDGWDTGPKMRLKVIALLAVCFLSTTILCAKAQGVVCTSYDVGDSLAKSPASSPLLGCRPEQDVKRLIPNLTYRPNLP